MCTYIHELTNMYMHVRTCTCITTLMSDAGGRINFLRRKSSDLFGELFSERNSFIEDGSIYSFYEEISLDLKQSSNLVKWIE